jgi:catechol 2,3-dioxygenase-like lactoylglutathione lyase family enzyme
MPERRVVIDHLTIGVRDAARSRAFYAAALEPLGYKEMGPWSDEEREMAFGAEGADDFAISSKYAPGGQLHIAFAADSRSDVDVFYAAALAAGGEDNGAPGGRDPSTRRGTTGRSCSIRTGTTRKPFAMARRVRNSSNNGSAQTPPLRREAFDGRYVSLKRLT